MFLSFTLYPIRYTFYINLTNAGMKLKVLQHIMRHSNITVTLNYYTYATFRYP
ncbi:tyrosine-type recombinase/integrase [Lachnospiraceae bacterium 45-P1]